MKTHGMRQRITQRAGALLLMLAAAVGYAEQEAEMVFVDGYVDVKLEDGTLFPADFGEIIRTGDSVITEDGSAELELASGGTVRISPDTVFTLREIGADEARQAVLATSLGRIAFRFQRLAGTREPAIGTASAVAGVRGTEVTVYAGVDGSSLFIVDSGEVAVQSAGRTVVLGPNTGVEVQPNQPPGEPFDALERSISYEDWNQDRLDAFLGQPAAAVEGLAGRMEEFIAQIQVLAPLYEASVQQLQEERDRLPEIEEKDGREARVAHYEQVVAPLQVQTQRYYVNLRFYARSALSLRRYVLGRLSIIMQATYWNRTDDPVYRAFIESYETVLARYEALVVPHLEPFDI